VVDLRDACSLDEVRLRLVARADRLGPGEWLLARGVNELRLAEGRLPDRALLDQWVGDIATLLTRTCAHVAVANSAALGAAGVTPATPDPPGGDLDRDANGVPTGLLRETAIALVERHAPAPTERDYRDWIGAAQRSLGAAGVVAATDPGVDREVLAAYRAMEVADELLLRTSVMRLAPEGRAARSDEIEAPVFGERLVVDTAKFFLDGGLSGATAAISRDYRHAPTRGVLRMTAEEFAERVVPYERAGYSVAAHAIGDVAIGVALDAWESLALSKSRRRLEHLGLPTPDQLRRLGRLGVIIVTQPRFLAELGPNFGAYLPEDFPVTPYPFRSMLDAGLVVAFSSDGPVVADVTPLAGVHGAATRSGVESWAGRDERLSVDEALGAYTLGAALAEGQGAWSGSLDIGKRADLVVLRRDPCSTPLDEWETIEVDATYVDGQAIYER
jgi:predicted amidohydrolase YtcJ